MLRVAKNGLSALAFAASGAARNTALRQMVFNAIRLKRIELERFRSIDECRFIAYCFLNRHRSSAQILQDLWVSYELDEKRNGFFVEFGATDGVTSSNTWLLEKERGWSGILAEPNPFWHAELATNRSAAIDHRCVSAASDTKVKFLATDKIDPELSGMAEFSTGDHFAKVRAEGSELEVETVSLNCLLDEHNAPEQIDYMSIDTEGSEYECLRNFDFSSRSVALISVEQNRQTEGAIESLLAANGYHRVFREISQWDGWYVRQDHSQANRSSAVYDSRSPASRALSDVSDNSVG
jgi:FkbM family methyltransferase